MPSRGQGVTLTFAAWDTAANGYKAGETTGTLTLKWIHDGTSSTPTNAMAEVDSTNVPGIYKLTLTDAECTCNFGTLAGKSSNAGIVVIPTSIAFEQLPIAVPAAANGLPTLGTSAGQLNPSSGNIAVGGYASGQDPATLVWGASTKTVTGVAGSVTGSVGAVAAGVTVGGYSAGQDPATLVWGAGTKTVTSVTGSVGSVTGAVGSVTGAVGSVTTSVTVGGYAAGQDPGTRVWDVARTTHQLSGTFGEALPDAAASDPGGLLTVGTGSGQVEPAGGGVALVSSGMDAVSIETGINARQALSGILAACCGVLSGAGTNDITIKGGNVETTRITAVTDGSGNRTSVTLNVPA